MIADTLTLITLFTTFIYFIIGILIHYGLSRKYGRTDLKPSVTILVAARNEEEYLPACLDSLVNQTYPSDLLQIIIINDQSSDKTKQIVIDYAKEFSYLELVNTYDQQNGLKGKMNALAQGMDWARGEIILVTDADCRVPGTWVSEMAAYFTEGVALVGSLTAIHQPDGKSGFFDNIQAFDWYFLQAIAAGTAGINLPVSVLGNNFGFKKSVYNLIGGFRSMDFSLTEDMTLLNTIAKNTDLKIVYPLQKSTMIQSLPLNNLGDFIQQRKRWLSGGMKAPLWGWILMSTSFLAHFSIVVNLFLLNFTIAVISGLLLTLGIDLSLLWRMLRKSGNLKVIKYFIPFEFFYFFYTIILAIDLIFPGRIYWKERSF